MITTVKVPFLEKLEFEKYNKLCLNPEQLEFVDSIPEGSKVYLYKVKIKREDLKVVDIKDCDYVIVPTTFKLFNTTSPGSPSFLYRYQYRRTSYLTTLKRIQILNQFPGKKIVKAFYLEEKIEIDLSSVDRLRSLLNGNFSSQVLGDQILGGVDLEKHEEFIKELFFRGINCRLSNCVLIKKKLKEKYKGLK